LDDFDQTKPKDPRANFNNMNTSNNLSTFGTITSAGDPRIGQLALRLFF